MTKYDVVEKVAEEAFAAPVTSYERAIVSHVYDLIADDIRHEVESELLEYVENAVMQSCHVPDEDVLDSMALSTWADALRLLAAHGRVEIISEYGRRVIARLATEVPDATNDD